MFLEAVFKTNRCKRMRYCEVFLTAYFVIFKISGKAIEYMIRKNTMHIFFLVLHICSVIYLYLTSITIFIRIIKNSSLGRQNIITCFHAEFLYEKSVFNLVYITV